MHDVLIVSHSQAKETEAGVDGVDDDAVYWGWQRWRIVREGNVNKHSVTADLPDQVVEEVHVDSVPGAAPQGDGGGVGGGLIHPVQVPGDLLC